mmetsp:Transcript_53949/g.94619  ORF Transcript_53949/g.94619 Transcript_53949/m.94619 type:complete len:396 (+) Transcript_53949:121-1308(+)
MDFVSANELRTPTFKSCPAGQDCEHFIAFSNYQFSKEGLQHLQAYTHLVRPCRYRRECRAHRRLCEGGWRFADQCHCAMFSHGRPGRADWKGAPAMAGADPAYCGPQSAKTAGGRLLVWPDLEDEAAALELDGIALVQAELEAHGFGYEMWMLEGVVPEKRNHPRLIEAHESEPLALKTWGFVPDKEERLAKMQAIKRKPILDVELFAGLLYTGTDAQGEIRRALRMPVSEISIAEGWRWTLTALRHLIIKLAENPPERLYHGLNNVRPPSPDTTWGGGVGGVDHGRSWTSYNNFVSGSMSLEMAKIFARGEGCTVSKATITEFGSVFHFDMENAKNCAVICADMRWISKFADEQEWLMVPAHYWGGLKLLLSRSEPLPTGGELLHQECQWDWNG